MNNELITKRTDSNVQRWKEIRDDRDSAFLFCEGEKVINELAGSSLSALELIADESMRKELDLAMRRFPSPPKAFLVSKNVMSYISDLETPPGIIAIASRPKKIPLDEIVRSSENPLFLVLHRLQLPSNVGALLRTAEAANVSAVLTTRNSAHPFSPKSIRASTGSIFRVPVHSDWDLPTLIDVLKKHSIHILATSARAATDYSAVDWSRPTALIMGSEGAGFTNEEEKFFDSKIRIPMSGQVESLNVGSAAAICLFEAVRQRKKV